MIGILLLVIFSFTTLKKDNPKTTLLDGLSSQLEKEILTDKDECLAITVIKNDTIIYFKGCGHFDKKHKLLPDTSTIFRIGSITKSFTTVLMLKLIEEGYFKLNDPIEKYVPEIKNLQGYTDSTKITFKQLASHTSGLEREPSRQDLSFGSTSEWEHKLLKAIPETKFALKPNTAMLYSNIGYGILGLAISRAANGSFIK
ncbi:MAG TPA: serine hydrolase domain-containing protein, partial [Bacteroidia bacterium]|nr:serine hydrolase domain-containing protein [Bacteroidia bacterium]